MRKPSSLIFSISLLLLCRLSVAQTDGLKAKRNHFFVDINCGVTALNKMSMALGEHYYTDKSYDINSKVKGNYEFSLTYLYKHFRVCVGANYLQSEFKGFPFTVGAGDIPYKSSTYPYYYSMVQHVKYNVLYSNIGVGYQKDIKQKHSLSVDVMFHIPTKYFIRIDNNYTPDHQYYDTTLFAASKHCFNDKKDFGYFPRFSCKLSYSYYFYKNLGVNCNLSFMYCFTYKVNVPNTDQTDISTVLNNSNHYSYLAYDINRQIVLIPSIGLKYRLK